MLERVIRERLGAVPRADWSTSTVEVPAGLREPASGDMSVVGLVRDRELPCFAVDTGGGRKLSLLPPPFRWRLRRAVGDRDLVDPPRSSDDCRMPTGDRVVGDVGVPVLRLAWRRRLVGDMSRPDDGDREDGVSWRERVGVLSAVRALFTHSSATSGMGASRSGLGLRCRDGRGDLGLALARDFGDRLEPGDSAGLRLRPRRPERRRDVGVNDGVVPSRALAVMAPECPRRSNLTSSSKPARKHDRATSWSVCVCVPARGRGHN